jgi:hypothetical protein
VSVTAAEQAHNGFTLWPEWPVVIKPKTNGDERPQNIQLKGVGIHVYERPTEYEVLGLPEPVEGVYFLVEEAVGAFLKGTRSDVLVSTLPYFGRVTREHSCSASRSKAIASPSSYLGDPQATFANLRIGARQRPARSEDPLRQRKR